MNKTMPAEVLLPLAQCPKCDAYEVFALTGARTLRCHSCSHEYKEPSPVARYSEPIPQWVKKRFKAVLASAIAL